MGKNGLKMGVWLSFFINSLKIGSFFKGGFSPINQEQRPLHVCGDPLHLLLGCEQPWIIEVEGVRSAVETSSVDPNLYFFALISSFTFKYISKGTCKSWLVKQLKRVQCQMVTISSFLFDGIGRVLCYRKALRRRRRVMAITMANGHHIVSTDPNRKRVLGHKIEPGLRNIPFVVANIIFFLI